MHWPHSRYVTKTLVFLDVLVYNDIIKGIDYELYKTSQARIGSGQGGGQN